MITYTKEQVINALTEGAHLTIGKDFDKCSTNEKYQVLATLVEEKARELKARNLKDPAARDKKQVFYFSMEFLIGKLLENYLMNFGMLDTVKEALKDLGEDFDALAACERDPGLGNGGLGRLAACFIDSLASLGYEGHGNGIRYRYGLFEQHIEGGCQVEKEDNWLKDGYPFEYCHMQNKVVVGFGGEVKYYYDNGEEKFVWEPAEKVLAVPYDVPVVGYGGEQINTLRLWSAEPFEEKFDMDAYNRGDYAAAIKNRADVEAITAVLYPNDNADPGKILRLKQEYLFVAAGIRNIVDAYKKNHGSDFSKFSDLIAIHTNDTHPSVCGPELMRIFLDEEKMSWDEAWAIVMETVSYTNHTVLPEAMEKWPIDMFKRLLPRVYSIIEEIDRRFCESFPRDMENWQEHLKNTAILWDGQVRTANLSIICGHSVNGVAALHTEILKRDVLKSFYKLDPDMFNNKTNGVTHRRFLAQCNPELSALITETIGDKWYKDADELKKLEDFKGDPSFIRQFNKCKMLNKERLASYVRETSGVILDPESIFDVQVKRFHAYKRQLLNLLKVIDLYDKIKNDPNFDMHPTTFVFAGKAAQGYAFAKDTIRLVNSVGHVVNNDPGVRGLIKVVFVPNFSVSNAGLIYPAANISEQISTAGLEASGTGNMKFMMNGALTLGTLDGANVEIVQQVGYENAMIFGLKAEEIDEIKANHSYYARAEYESNGHLKHIIDMLRDGTFAGLSGNFDTIFDALIHKNDEFFVIKDYYAYYDAFMKLNNMYRTEPAKWSEKSIINMARSGYFSSDRTIKEYAKDIWNI